MSLKKRYCSWIPCNIFNSQYTGNQSRRRYLIISVNTTCIHSILMHAEGKRISEYSKEFFLLFLCLFSFVHHMDSFAAVSKTRVYLTLYSILGFPDSKLMPSVSSTSSHSVRIGSVSFSLVGVYFYKSGKKGNWYSMFGICSRDTENDTRD